jgi:hypothetical protein
MGNQIGDAGNMAVQQGSLTGMPWNYADPEFARSASYNLGLFQSALKNALVNEMPHSAQTRNAGNPDMTVGPFIKPGYYDPSSYIDLHPSALNDVRERRANDAWWQAATDLYGLGLKQTPLRGK